jgi:hypothetical protein
MVGSALHDALWKSLEKPGELRLNARLDLYDMLRSAVQPGSHIDYEWPPETASLSLHFNVRLQWPLAEKTSETDPPSRWGLPNRCWCHLPS